MDSQVVVTHDMSPVVMENDPVTSPDTPLVSHPVVAVVGVDPPKKPPSIPKDDRVTTSEEKNDSKNEQTEPTQLNNDAVPVTNNRITRLAVESDEKARQGTTSLLSLPIDALHAIASFLKPMEWHEFGQVSRTSHRVAMEVVRRVRIHGFKCATEIVAAWKLGHHEDAKELASLYISEGVPVYPRSLGYSHHTLLWRMQTEVNEMLDPERNEIVDAFYRDRGDFRARNGGMMHSMTYLEVKSLFWMQKEHDEDTTKSNFSSPLRRTRGAPFQELVEARAASTSGKDTMSVELPSRQRKLRLFVHQHLLDQHLIGRHSFDEADGAMMTPPVSLSADFYHPNPARRYSSWLARMRTFSDEVSFTPGDIPRFQTPTNVVVVGAPTGVEADVHHRFHAPLDDDLFDPHLFQSPFKDYPVLNLLELEVYSRNSTVKPERDCPANEQSLVERSLRLSFELYQQRLEALLSRGDSSSFEECLLDFWDEYFPLTAGFQFHDRHTVVPRISHLKEFLTKPCPKAVGIVQCEIERIRTSARGKGVDVKGRLFPTYDYRLFIRSRPFHAVSESALNESDQEHVRRDTVLMVAKNRGRKSNESSGIISVASPKKGSNNYFLHMPQQIDVDDHFNKVNGDRMTSKMTPNGASHQPVLSSSYSVSTFLGRLQSNFVGTEFQIFVPKLRKSDGKSSSVVYSPSDDELDYDSGFSSDNAGPKRSRFGMLSLRGSHSPPGSISEEGFKRSQMLGRAISSPDITQGRPGRSNRRAIANFTESDQRPVDNGTLFEAENGVITYTANLLGSRPRIMDVCIPKPEAGGTGGGEWTANRDNDHDENLDMLSSFRQLLHRLEMHEATPEAGDTTHFDDMGLMVLQNRPPWWNIELGSFVLNFGGRVSVASVKNFQLCERDDHEKILLQFGRIQGRHSFTMDFQYPLTAVQAFSIAISSLQSKISFG